MVQYRLTAPSLSQLDRAREMLNRHKVKFSTDGKSLLVSERPPFAMAVLSGLGVSVKQLGKESRSPTILSALKCNMLGCTFMTTSEEEMANHHVTHGVQPVPPAVTESAPSKVSKEQQPMPSRTLGRYKKAEITRLKNMSKQGLSPAEIAKTLNRSEKSVRKFLGNGAAPLPSPVRSNRSAPVTTKYTSYGKLRRAIEAMRSTAELLEDASNEMEQMLVNLQTLMGKVS